MINKEDVQHIAKLARLGITKDEEEKFTKDLSAILEYIEKLKEVDVEGVEPTSHSVVVENVMRKDEVGKPDNQQTSKLIKLMPDKKDGYLKVKSVF